MRPRREDRQHRVGQPKLRMIISGGQTGADQGALEAARDYGIETGGWMPHGFKTLTGPRPDMADEYGMREHESTSYPPRTEANVVDADATIRFASDFESTGERCTLRYIKQYRKPWLDVDMTAPWDVQRIVDWIRRVNPRVLNVAGNSEITSPCIQDSVRWYLGGVLLSLGFERVPVMINITQEQVRDLEATRKLVVVEEVNGLITDQLNKLSSVWPICGIRTGRFCGKCGKTVIHPHVCEPDKGEDDATTHGA